MDMASAPESTFNKQARSILFGLTTLLFVALGPGQAASAFELTEDIKLSGHAQLWFTLHEQMEDAGGLTQFPSGDEAATSTSGFSLNRARLGVRAFFLERLIELATQLRLEKNVAILDLYFGIHFSDWLQLYFGQFKVPAPRINDIVRERRAITPDTALRLARYFGTTPQFWLNLQTSYDLKNAEQKIGTKIEREVNARQVA